MRFSSLILILLIAGVYDVSADNSPQQEKLREPYPGEEVVGPDGRKARRWSTRGPVEVSPPPQPFDYPEQRRAPAGLLLNVDTHQIRQQDGPPVYIPPSSNTYHQRPGKDMRVKDK